MLWFSPSVIKREEGKEEGMEGERDRDERD